MAAFHGERFEINPEDLNPVEPVAGIDELVANTIIPSTHRTSPIVVIVVGMAGTGKTTLMHRINLYMNELGLNGYYVNLDPAVKTTPFACNIDIRDTINYKEVMLQYGLGPNGAILTSLNLFATKFNQVVELLEKRADTLDYIFIDTPGQIEAFTWSAGGQIIHELLATAFPTTILYTIDTPRCTSPTTFMSNMLYACSILYKSKLPITCCFNKTDIKPYDEVRGWIDDYEKYLEAIDRDAEDYMGSFNRSLALAMDEFYTNIATVGVSAVTGNGMAELFAKLEESGREFSEIYLPELQKRIKDREQKETLKQQADLDRLKNDLQQTQGDKLILSESSFQSTS